MGRPRGIGKGEQRRSDAARSWGGSAVLGRQRGLGGSPHSRFAVVPPTRGLPWFPPLALGIKTMMIFNDK
ncbi:MAG: hypothetical protein F6K55_06420 [Moorea sp. SIO4A3]|nr:hypothetical protein [Moorena sp. SIO4A3]